MKLYRGITDVVQQTTTTLEVGTAQVLFWKGVPFALFDGEVFFPDSKMKSAAVKFLNSWHPEAPRTRVPVADFNWYVSSTLMRQLRSLLRRVDDNSSGS